MNPNTTLRVRLLGATLALAMLSLFWLAGVRQRQWDSAGRPVEERLIAATNAEPQPAVVNGSLSGGHVSTVPAVASAAASAASAAPRATWSLREDAEPRSHRFDPAKPSRRKPLRSAAVRIAPNWLADARAGDDVRFDLGAGLVVRGVFKWAHREELPDVITFAGTLQEPNGAFHLEHHAARGWAGSFQLKDSDEIVQLVPDRHEAGVTRLEVWPRRETVCASVDEDGDPATPPPADSSIDHTQLQSRPGAPNVIYLDFDGETVSGTQWNAFYNSFNNIHAAPSGLNREEIIAAWRRASEDWATFNVNVTTRRSIYNATGQESRTMVVCTPSKAWYDSNVGGVATLDSFNNLFVSAICWCFNVDNYIECAETISHEAGHTMGNSHASWESDTGLFYDEYYDGHETDCGIYWAPIMGNSFGNVGTEGLTQFTIDDTYPGSTVGEDQLDEIAYELGLLDDEHFDSLGGVPVLGTQLTLQNDAVKRKGLINTGSDVDAFWIELPAGGWVIRAEPNQCGPNVDVWLELQQINNVVSYTLLRRSANSGSTSGDGASQSLSAGVETPQGAGQYRIRVGSDQCGGAHGYPKYGGVGTYTLTIRRQPGFESAAPVLTGSRPFGLTVGAKVVKAQIVFSDASKFDYFFNGQNLVYLERIGGGVALPGTRWNGPSFSTDDSGSAPVFRARQEYRFNAPGGWWDNAEAGTYRLRIVAGSVSDVWGNAIPQITRTIGTLEPDTVAPTITGEATPSIVASGGSQAPSITITIKDQSPILVTGNGVGAFEAISTSGGATLPLTRLRYSKSDGGREWVLHLAPTVPAKGWDIDDTSVYNVVLKAGTVRDTEGHIAPATTITTFTVATTLWTQDFDDTSIGHGFSLAAGWQTGLVHGIGGRYDDPAPDDGNDTPVLGFGLTGSTQYANNLNERAATTLPIDTQGYERLTLRYRRWLTVRAGDSARIEINNETTNDNWTTVWSSPSDRDFTQRGWTLHEIPLPLSFANGTLYVRWIMGATDASGTAGGWNVDDIEIVAAGTYQPARLVLNPLRQFTSATEGGSSATYTLRLNQQPTQPVIVNLVPDAQSTLNDTQMVFSTANWATPQTVTVVAVNDALVEGPHRTVIHHVCVGRSDLQFFGVAVDRTVGIVDNDTPLIATQPQDATLLPGTSVTLAVTPVRSLTDFTYQWFRGTRGNTSSHSLIIGATNPTLRVTLPATATGPVLYWVRVNAPGRPSPEEHSRQVTLSPLTGFAAFKQRLLQRGYTQAQINAPGFAEADPDGNGLSHFVEHAVGIFPGEQAIGFRKYELDPAEVASGGDADFLVTLPPLQPDVLYLIQSASDLSGWTTVAELSGDPHADPATVIHVPSLGTGRLFVQLQVTPLPQ